MVLTLRGETAFRSDGRDSETVISDWPARVIVSVVDAGREVGAETSDGHVSIYLLQGGGTIVRDGVEERMSAEGEVLLPLDEARVSVALGECAAEGFDAVAICLLHGWRWPAHEQRLAALARRAGFRQVYASHEVEPLIRFVSRADAVIRRPPVCSMAARTSP